MSCQLFQMLAISRRALAATFEQLIHVLRLKGPFPCQVMEKGKQHLCLQHVHHLLISRYAAGLTCLLLRGVHRSKLHKQTNKQANKQTKRKQVYINTYIDIAIQGTKAPAALPRSASASAGPLPGQQPIPEARPKPTLTLVR